tara:strand:- start:270 stop:494 length:225 start_codon:yes stop_codon:yes gene_type:complete
VVRVKSSEANIISFSVLINTEGDVVTELSGIPDKDLSKVFSHEDAILMRQIIRFAKTKLEDLHEDIEAELQAIY